MIREELHPSLGLILALGLLLSIPAPAPAGNCFEQASSKLNPGTSLTLHLADGTTVKGRLAFLDVREKSLLLRPATKLGNEPVRYAMRDVARLDYRIDSSSPGWMVAGAAGGALFGSSLIGLLATLTDDCGSDSPGARCDSGTAFWAGGLIGGLAGLTLGIILPAALRHPESIACTESAVP